MSGALIVLAGLGGADFAWADGLRRAYYPAERNRVPAHLTLVHSLPPSVEMELGGLLKRLSAGPPPSAATAGLVALDEGTAIAIRSDELDRLRDHIIDHFAGSLGYMDRAGWRPHITIQNKVGSKETRHLREQLSRDWRDRPVHIASLELVRYRDGPWEPVRRYPFRG